MQRVNAAASDSLAASPTTEPTSSGAGTEQRHDWAGTTRDIPSFNVDALPAQTFEALLLAAAELGEVEDDDPPYELHTLLAAPIACWCRLEVVPDAGASTVSIWIAPCADQPVPEMTAVRNAWITAINGLDWAAL